VPGLPQLPFLADVPEAQRPGTRRRADLTENGQVSFDAVVGIESPSSIPASTESSAAVPDACRKRPPLQDRGADGLFGWSHDTSKKAQQVK